MEFKNQIMGIFSKYEIKIYEIQNLLNQQEDIFNFLVQESDCRKWSKWKEDESIHIYPCVCSIREHNCIIIETYYELKRVLEQYKKEAYFKEIVSEFKSIRNDKEAVAKWVIKYEDIGSKLFFALEVVVRLEFETLRVKLNKNEFKHTLEFQKYFQMFYC